MDNGIFDSEKLDEEFNRSREVTSQGIPVVEDEWDIPLNVFNMFPNNFLDEHLIKEKYKSEKYEFIFQI